MLDLWYRALSAPIGVEIVCNDPEGVRKRLYAIRKEIQDQSLANISICLSPFDSDKLWLLKRTRNAA